MSVGAFLGIRASFTDQAAGNDFLKAVARTLKRAGLPPYIEPMAAARAHGQRFGRSSLDHHSAATLARLGGLAATAASAEHLSVIALNPYRVAFLPIDFASPLETDYSEPIGGEQTRIHVASGPGLRRDLVALAPHLGIPVAGGILADDVAARIDDGESLDGSDDGQRWDDERTAWLLLFEGARLALARRTALSLAG